MVRFMLECDYIEVLGILAAVVALILYGSLYPWRFQAKTLPGSPWWILLHAWDFRPDRRFIADAIVNLALYAPLGMSAYLAFRRRCGRGLAAGLSILLGCALSAAVEMAQLYTPSRNTSAVDWLNNTLGSALGVAAGVLFERALGGPDLRFRKPREPIALALLFCWLAALVFPVFPVTSLPVYRLKLARFGGASFFALAPLLSAALTWFAAGRMLVRASVPRPELWLALSVLLVPAQFVLLTRQPLPADLLGAAIGLILFLVFGTTRFPFGTVFMGLILIRGLAPFHLAASPAAFEWLPFAGVLGMDWQIGVRVLIEKTFYYGAALWLLREDGWPPARAISAVVLWLAGIEFAQRWLSGHVSEITDPLMALGLGLILHQAAGRRPRLSFPSHSPSAAIEIRPDRGLP